MLEADVKDGSARPRVAAGRTRILASRWLEHAGLTSRGLGRPRLGNRRPEHRRLRSRRVEGRGRAGRHRCGSAWLPSAGGEMLLHFQNTTRLDEQRPEPGPAVHSPGAENHQPPGFDSTLDLTGDFQVVSPYPAAAKASAGDPHLPGTVYVTVDLSADLGMDHCWSRLRGRLGVPGSATSTAGAPRPGIPCSWRSRGRAPVPRGTGGAGGSC